MATRRDYTRFTRKLASNRSRNRLAADRLKIIRFYDQMRVRYLDESDYAPFDADGCCFTNLNTPAELADAERLLGAPR